MERDRFLAMIIPYTPTPLKSGEFACQRRWRRFWCIHDPPWLPGRRIETRPDRADSRRVRRPSAVAPRQRAGSAGRRHELRGDREGAVCGRRHDPGLVPALSGRWGRGLDQLRPRRGRVQVIPTAESPDSPGSGKTLSYQRHARFVESRDFRPLVLPVVERDKLKAWISE